MHAEAILSWNTEREGIQTDLLKDPGNNRHTGKFQKGNKFKEANRGILKRR